MSRTDAADTLERLLERKNGLAREAAAPPLARKLQELRAWQAERLARTYADLRRDPLTGEAVSFFLAELYGPQDFTRRDRDLGRAWRLFRRALPARMLEVLSLALELDVLSAELDLQMARRLDSAAVSAQAYAEAYRAVGRPEARRRQIGLAFEIGTALAGAVRTPFVHLALRAAHGPAHLAGFGVLQDFLERGFAAFTQLPHPERFLGIINGRETRLMEILMKGGTIPAEEAPPGAAGAA